MIHGAYSRFTHRRADTLRVLSVCFDVLSVVAAAVGLTAIAIYGGFDTETVSYADVAPLLRVCQAIFAANILFGIIFRFRATMAQARPLRRIFDLMLLLSYIPAISHWRYVFVGILAAYAGVYICSGVIRALGKHTNPSLILAASFLLFISIGSALLMLPRATTAGISLIDSIYVSTSAVCICGLTPIDVSTTFTPLGLCIVAVMMQVGALGVMTFTSFFALFFSGRPSIYSQLMVKDMIYSKTINSLLPSLLYILLFTLSVEAIGAVAIYWSVADTIPGYTQGDYITFAAFHSISAFCNAGFSTLGQGLSNPALLHGNQLVYLVISALVVAGGIGFPILVNAKDALFTRIRELWRTHKHQPHVYSLNSRVALLTSVVLFIVGAAAFLLLEHNHSLAGLSPYQKCVQSIFNAVTPRSAGFTSVNPASFLPATIIIIMFLMWVGGGSQSTAGGIKVNTFAAALLHLRATVLGHSRVTACNRTISTESLSRAQAVVILSIISYLALCIITLIIEPHLPVKALLFEALSALFTVGSSLGITAQLGITAKIIMSVAMFIGRVGLLSLLMGVAGDRHRQYAVLPSDNLIIN